MEIARVLVGIGIGLVALGGFAYVISQWFEG